MTIDDAMAALTDARMQLFKHSQRREEVVLRRVRLEAPDDLDTINKHIAKARDKVQAATADVLTALGQ